MRRFQHVIRPIVLAMVSTLLVLVSTAARGDAEAAPITATQPPAIVGTPKVGSTLSASPPTWSVEGVTTSAPQWTVGETAVAANDDGTYTVHPSDVGAPIQVSFTGAKDGYADGIAVSEAVTGLRGDAPVALKPPAISGQAVVGHMLETTPGLWKETGLAFTYQWLRAGKPIQGATHPTHRVTRDDVGQLLSVRVTASREGYADGIVLSHPVGEVRWASTTTMRIAARVIEQGTPLRVSITVTVAGVRAPSGKLVVYIDGASDVRPLLAADRGTRTLKIAGLAPGRHFIRAGFADNPRIAGSVADFVWVRVVRAHAGSGGRAPL